MRPITALRTWLRKTDQFWDYLLAPLSPVPHLAAKRRFEVLQLEDRVVPDNRPLPYPVIAVGPGDGAGLASFFAFEETFTGGVRLAVADLNQDKHADLILTAGVGGAPRVRVLSGATFQTMPGPLGDFYAYDPADRGGAYVAAGDVTG